MSLLGSPSVDAETLSLATVSAAEAELRRFAEDAGVRYCYWLLTELASLAKRGDYEKGLIDLGLVVPHAASAVDFIAAVAEHVEGRVRLLDTAVLASEVAQQSLREVLVKLAARHVEGLFGATLDDVRESYRGLSQPGEFGAVSREFFAALLRRSLAYYVDKELSNHVGAHEPLADVDAAERLHDGIGRFASETAAIVEKYADDWYGRRHWQGSIADVETRRFLRVAFRKIRHDLRLGRSVT